jgi:2-dehydropantoate 2-reductase
MNFLIYGAGAIGGYMGGRLALSAHTVTFIARPAQAAILNERRLTLDNVSVTVKAVTTPAEAFSRSQYDCLILTLKSFDTEAAIADLKGAMRVRAIQAKGPHSGELPLPPILCLQNGVDNEPLLGAAFGPGNVIAGTVLTAVATPEPGVVVVEKSRGVGIGGGHPLSEGLVSEFSRAGIPTRLYPNPESMKWTKLLTNLMGNATAAICDVSTAEVFTHPGLYAIEVGALKEALAVMKAKRLSVMALPRTPTVALAFALQWLPPWLYQPIFRRALAGGRGNKLPSLHMDLSAGKTRSEVGYLNGAVARHAEALSLKAPINRGLNEILGNIVAGHLDWKEYCGQPDRLTNQVLNK